MPAGELQPPSAHPDDAPLVCLSINQEWLAYLIGMVYPARYPEYWGGTLEENRRARADVMTLMSMLQDAEDCDMATCCEQQIYQYRINPDTGRLERTKDNGTTWTTDPADPANVIVQQPPPTRGGVPATKCDAATNFLEHFEDVIAGCSDNLGTAVTIVQLAGGIAALLLDIFIIVVTEGTGIAVVTTITGAIFAGITAAFTEGKAAFDAYWTETELDGILCAAYCTLEDNGQWTQTGWEDFKHEARINCTPGAALDMVLTSVNAAGYVGGNNMASYGNAATADCGSCDCSDCSCYENWFVRFGTPISHVDCIITGQSAMDGDDNAISFGWGDDHTPCSVIDWTWSRPGTPTGALQWYLADGSGPFTGTTPPFGTEISDIEFFVNADPDTTPYTFSFTFSN